MDTFWFTQQTFKSLYGEDFRSVPYYGMVHFLELLLIAIATIIIFKVYKNSDRKRKQTILNILTILILLDEALKYFVTIPSGQWNWQLLPLHLCSINIFVCTYHTITGSDEVKDFLYAVCIPGTMMALLMPAWFICPVFNIMHLHSYTIHALLIVYSVIVLADGYRPKLRRIPINALMLVIIATPIYVLNKILDTNFMFMNKPNEIFFTKWLYKLFGNYYFLSFPFILMIIWIFLYLPWLIGRKAKAQ